MNNCPRFPLIPKGGANAQAISNKIHYLKKLVVQPTNLYQFIIVLFRLLVVKKSGLVATATILIFRLD